MSETAEAFDIYHPDVVEAFAASWASIDGKLEKFEAEKIGKPSWEDLDNTGTYEGYMAEADELLRRAAKRIEGFDLFTRLDPSP